MKQIGVIGAGAAGICAVKHILATPGLNPIAWELSSEIGGTWVHTWKTGLDENGIPIHSSMYDNMRTNLPKEIMKFPDYAFPSGGRSFVHHTEVHKYLQDYAENFKVMDHVKFLHHVDLVERIDDKEDGETKWRVIVTDLKNKSSKDYICDGLLICNGHYSVPKYPQIESKKNFTGLSLHSHNYREPSAYEGLSVIVLGAGASGLDISLEVSKVAKKVYLSHNLPVPVPSKFPDNFSQVAGIKAAEVDGFILNDKSVVKVDAIIYCTGYYYTYPFLSPTCEVTVVDNIVSPLFNHMIHIKYPSLAFVGIPFLILPFPLFDFQIRYYLSTLCGNIKLPCRERMFSICDEKIQSLLLDDKISHYHQLGDKQWMYLKELSSSFNDGPASYLEKIWKITWFRRIFKYQFYKNYNYDIVENGLDCEVVEILDSNRVNTRLSLMVDAMWGISVLIFSNAPAVLRAILSKLRKVLVKYRNSVLS